MRKIFMCGILIFFVSIGTGYFYSSFWKKENMSFKNSVNVVDEKIAETSYLEEKISFNTNFALKKYYTKCGHLKLNYSELPVEFINLSKVELEKKYPEWEVEEFNKNNVILKQNINSICDDHYVLKLIDDNVNIYHIENDNIFKFYKTTDVSKEYLTSEDINNLENGIFVYGINNLNKALEDFE